MVDIEKVSGEYHHASPIGQIKSSAGRFGGDVLELIELQGKLFKADAKKTIEKSMAAAISALMGFFCLMGCLPVMSFGLASAVTRYFVIEPWIAQLLIGGVLSIISITIITFALRTFAKTGTHFKRSTDEFSKSMEWAKDIFGGTPTKN